MYTSAWVMIGKNPMKLNNEVPVRTAEPASHILFCSLSKKKIQNLQTGSCQWQGGNGHSEWQKNIKCQCENHAGQEEIRVG